MDEDVDADVDLYTDPGTEPNISNPVDSNLETGTNSGTGTNSAIGSNDSAAANNSGSVSPNVEASPVTPSEPSFYNNGSTTSPEPVEAADEEAEYKAEEKLTDTIFKKLTGPVATYAKAFVEAYGASAAIAGFGFVVLFVISKRKKEDPNEDQTNEEQ